MKLEKLLQRIGLTTILLLLAALPVFFLPFTAEYFDFNKNTSLFVVVLITGLSWAGSMIAAKQIRFTLSPLSLPIIGVSAAWIVSAVLKSPNISDAFLIPGQAGTAILLCLLFFFTTNLINNKRELSLAVGALFVGFGLMGIMNILWSSGLPMPIFNSPLWNPLGSPITTIVINFLAAIIAVIFILKSQKMEVFTYLATVVVIISLVAGILFSYRLFTTTGINISLMPQSTAWSVTLDALKSSALLGTGPGSYAISAVRFRPISDNLGKNWNLRFGAPSNYYLEIITTLGVFGILAYLVFMYKTTGLILASIKENISAESVVLSVGLLILFIVHFFLPATFITISLIFLFATLLVASIKVCNTHTHLVSDTNIDVVTAVNSVKTPVLPWIIMTLMLALSIPSSVVWFKAYAADVYYQQALVAATANDGRTTYTKLISAINLNPYKDTYRSAYSQTNFLLATSLSNKKDITEQDKKAVNDLIQVSITEGKQAVSLAPTKASNLENLANLYSNLIKIAKGAEEWAVVAYRQAVNLDPTNPNLLIALGGVMYKTGNYDEAIRLFIGAVNLKPDLPNAYYNLANAYKQTKDYEKAVSSMQEVVKLVDSTSADYAKATSELLELQKLAGTKTGSADVTSTQLTKPDEDKSPKVTIPVNLEPSTPSSKPATVN